MAKQVSLILSHWHRLFEGFQESPQQIYSLLQEAIDRRKMEDIKISRITYKESGLLSAKREYFRVRRKDHIFDICAAPFGASFFVSWWLGTKWTLSWRQILLLFFLPPIGIMSVLSSRRETYYTLDTALMFQDSVHSAVLEVMDEVTEGKGIRAMSELERKPILSDLFKRKLK